MNTDNYNKALDQLVFYRRMAALAEGGTPTYSVYIAKLAAGSAILAIAYGKGSDAVNRDLCKAYDSKYANSAW